MRFGKYVSPFILEEMVKYTKRLDIVEKKLYNAETFKGKTMVWAELLVSGHYVLYGNEDDDWFAEYFDPTGAFLKGAEDVQPFDFRRE